MEYIEPNVFHVASTRSHSDVLMDYLKAAGAGEWRTDSPSDPEMLVEVAGRLCYRSFKPGLNANVTKVREGNKEYIANILNSKHGSVLEHGSDTYIFHNISRVFTHELVRHRAGCSYSQESLRYVRLDELKCWYPEIFQTVEPTASGEMSANTLRTRLAMLWNDTFSALEKAQKELAGLLELDKRPFDLKKKMTSAMRRLAPIGLATDIMMTANHRVWRHVIQMRTNRHAEEEIRGVFNRVYEEQARCYPNIYQDSKAELVDGLLEVTFGNEKV